MKWGSEAAVHTGPLEPEGKERERSKQNQGRSKKVRTEILLSWECAHIPGKEAEMKGRRSWGKTGRENRTAIVPQDWPGAAPEQPASTVALCLNVIKGPVGANVWNPLTPCHSHTTAEPEREAVTEGSTGFLGSSAKKGQARGRRAREANPSFSACKALPPPGHCPQEFPEALP